MSTTKVCWPIPWDSDSAKERIVRHLNENGFEVNAERKDWRVFMFRKDTLVWTHAYTGLTKNAKATRNGFRISGPESNAIPEYAFYQNGIFYDK